MSKSLLLLPSVLPRRRDVARESVGVALTQPADLDSMSGRYHHNHWVEALGAERHEE